MKMFKQKCEMQYVATVFRSVHYVRTRGSPGPVYV